MKRQKIFLSSTNKWDDVTYNVQARPLTELLPFHTVRATDRNKVIVGDDNVIYGVQGMSYTLIPNSLIKSCIDEVIGEHDVKILHNPRGEFSMNIHLPSEVFTVGDDRDTIQKSVIINNSYNARVPFSVQGKVLNVTEGRVREKGMRVSYYREICKNGLMGWSDEFMSYDSYVTWLSKGQPHNYDKVKEIKTYVDEGIEETSRKEEVTFLKNFKHKNLDLSMFYDNLKTLLQDFIGRKASTSLQVYEQMQQKSMEGVQIEELIIDAGLPRKLAKIALDRLEIERQTLDAKSSLWLVYNSANYALFSQSSGLAIDRRYELDRVLFNNLNTQLI